MVDSEESAKRLKEQKDKTIGLIERDQIDAHPLGKSELDAELEDATEDVASDESFAEEKEAKTMPVFKAGSPETTREDIDERFSKEHSFEAETTVTGQKSSGTPKHAKLDKPADETPTES